MEGGVAYEDAFPQLSREGKQVAQDDLEGLMKDLPNHFRFSFKEALNVRAGTSSSCPQQTVTFNEAGKLKVPQIWKENARTKWNSCLIGFMIGRNLPFAVVKRVCLQLWGKRGLTQVSPVGPKRILLKFENEAMLDGILNRSDWHVAGCPILLRKWSVGIQLCDQELRNVPCWVQLSGIPLELWHKEGFIYLASVLGVPLKVDGRSERMANIGTARIQVSCSAVRELQRKIEVEGEEGVNIQIDVHYENVPLRCKECLVFGHSDSQSLRQRAGNRSRSRSRGPGARSTSTRGRKRHGNLARVNSSASLQSDANAKAIMWREMSNDESPASSVSGGNAAEPWRGFNAIPIGHADNLNGELYYNIPLENRWSIVPYEGDTGENQSPEGNPLEDKEIGEIGTSLQSSLNELLDEEGQLLGNVHEQGREGAIILGGSSETLEGSI
ncbi:hypothetical protein MLD38_029898 [Melastoma candidum]|uniref:Uncharacterized protein n=1 Tax=Melastoma candidum TaxID=119954 RepID=A0ACB9MJR8_9MYRT|nr:hypothetical protein MLD38_029898 [Melastoma candidum]